jgi:twitching motility protein PilT
METQSGYLDRLLTYCCDQNATDLHICIGSRPMMRVNSKLTTIPDTEVVSPIAVNLLVDPLLDQKKRDLLRVNRDMDFSFSKPGLGRFRCNIYRQRGSYALAIRMLSYEIPEFSSLGLPDTVESFAHKNKGLLLIAGTPGGGKSTTLASLTDTINSTYRCHILTIEDPIEYLHKHKLSLVSQREIGEDADSFASALHAALREDPDVIVIGEIHGPEAISAALTAVETGRLVLSALPAVGTDKAIEHMLDGFPAGQQPQIRKRLAAALEGIVSQQLLPRLDGPGLVAASEVLVITPAVRSLIRQNDSSEYTAVRKIIRECQSPGMQLMEGSLARLCWDGKISCEDGESRAPDPELFREYWSQK